MRHEVTLQLQQGQPLATLVTGRAEQLAICNELEAIADQLGGQIDHQRFTAVLDRLFLDLPVYQRDEEALYGILRDGAAEQTIIAQCADQALRDHRYYEDYALEIADAVQDNFADSAKRSPEALGYLLRCTFVGLRQHMAWEDVTLLGGLLRPLTAEEVEQFQNLLALNRKSHARRRGFAD
jgi:hypothetical protein